MTSHSFGEYHFYRPQKYEFLVAQNVDNISQVHLFSILFLKNHQIKGNHGGTLVHHLLQDLKVPGLD